MTVHNNTLYEIFRVGIIRVVEGEAKKVEMFTF